MGRIKLKDQLLEYAVRAAEIHGYVAVSRDQICEELGCSPAMINRYYGSLEGIRRLIIPEAIRVKNLNDIAQGILMKDRRALKVSEEIKAKIRERI